MEIFQGRSMNLQPRNSPSPAIKANFNRKILQAVQQPLKAINCYNRGYQLSSFHHQSI
jgi:hypothetical protein